MEVSIFPRLASELEKYVEIRLHTDKRNERSALFQKYKVRLTGSESNPIYVIVDPTAPDTAIAIFEGADLPTGQRFRQFLAANAR